MEREKLVFNSSDNNIAVLTIISISHVINHMLLVLFPPILAILSRDFGISIGTLGIILGIGGFINGALQLPYGFLVDNYNRILSYVLCIGLGGIGVLLLAISPSYEWLIIGQIILAAGVAGHHPVHFPLLSDSFNSDLRGRAYSIHGVAGNIGFAAAPIIIVGISALHFANWRHAFALIGIISLIFGIVSTYILHYKISDSVTKPNKSIDTNIPEDKRNKISFHSFIKYLRRLVDSPSILMITLVAFLASTTFWGVITYSPVFLEDAYNVQDDVASLALTAMFLVGGLMMLVGGTLSDKYQPGFILAGAYTLVGVLLFILSLNIVHWSIAVVFVVTAGSLGSLGNPVRDKIVDLISSRNNLGQSFAIMTIGIMAGNSIAPPVFGSMISILDYHIAFFMIGLTALLTVISTLVLIYKFIY